MPLDLCAPRKSNEKRKLFQPLKNETRVCTIFTNPTKPNPTKHPKPTQPNPNPTNKTNPNEMTAVYCSVGVHTGSLFPGSGRHCFPLSQSCCPGCCRRCNCHSGVLFGLGVFTTSAKRFLEAWRASNSCSSRWCPQSCPHHKRMCL